MDVLTVEKLKGKKPVNKARAIFNAASEVDKLSSALKALRKVKVHTLHWSVGIDATNLQNTIEAQEKTLRSLEEAVKHARLNLGPTIEILREQWINHDSEVQSSPYYRTFDRLLALLDGKKHPEHFNAIAFGALRDSSQYANYLFQVVSNGYDITPDLKKTLWKLITSDAVTPQPPELRFEGSRNPQRVQARKIAEGLKKFNELCTSYETGRYGHLKYSEKEIAPIIKASFYTREFGSVPLMDELYAPLRQIPKFVTEITKIPISKIKFSGEFVNSKGKAIPLAKIAKEYI